MLLRTAWFPETTNTAIDSVNMDLEVNYHRHGVLEFPVGVSPFSDMWQERVENAIPKEAK